MQWVYSEKSTMNNNNLTPYKPGQPGNPAGKRKGTKNLSSILKKILKGKVEWSLDDGTLIKCEYREAIIRRLLWEAYWGNVRAIQEIFNRTEGKVKEAIDTTNSDERQRT